MPASILYHGFGIQEHRYLRTEYTGGALVFHLERASSRQRCALCGSSQVIRKGKRIRRVRTMPMGSKPVFFALHLHRLQCKSCKGLRQERVWVSFPKKRWTRMLARYVVELLRHTTVEDVARHLQMSWDTVKEIHAWALEKKFRRRRICHLKYLGIDEVSVRRGHRYLTVCVDLESGEVVWVGEGREGQPTTIDIGAKTMLNSKAFEEWTGGLFNFGKVLALVVVGIWTLYQWNVSIFPKESFEDFARRAA